MNKRLARGGAALAVGLAIAAGPLAQTSKPISASEVPQRKTAAPLPPRGTYVPARTSWGDPAIAGAYNNSDETGIPFERPEAFAGRTLDSFTPEELAAITAERQKQTIERAPTLSEFPGATSPMHWFENYNAVNSRAWLVVDPTDGKVPPQTPEAQQRAAARQAARKGRGPADSWEDRSLYDRCITRGIPGSMMPAIYGNSYHIHQSPGFVTITYEMVHNTLVVETTNFTDKTPYRGSSEQLKMIEKFTPIGPDTVEWAVTLDDPHTWATPWTFTMNLTEDASQPPFEYACHEGNYG